MSLDFTLVENYCPHCKRGDRIDSFNITHNLGAMWKAAGCYVALYESDGRQASTVIETLQYAYGLMKHQPDSFRRYDSPNGWGVYENALPWLERVIHACEDHPEAIIEISR